jgi:hypothetical protein
VPGTAPVLIFAHRAFARAVIGRFGVEGVAAREDGRRPIRAGAHVIATDEGPAVLWPAQLRDHARGRAGHAGPLGWAGQLLDVSFSAVGRRRDLVLEALLRACDTVERWELFGDAGAER